MSFVTIVICLRIQSNYIYYIYYIYGIVADCIEYPIKGILSYKSVYNFNKIFITRKEIFILKLR